eukprot:COSAG02_NODE_1225_length_13785_cov_12.911588_1_plen_70_part_00
MEFNLIPEDTSEELAAGLVSRVPTVQKNATLAVARRAPRGRAPHPRARAGATHPGTDAARVARLPMLEP